MAYITADGEKRRMDEVEVRLKITTTALQDAAHLGLVEADLATLGAQLIRDPTCGRFSRNQTYRLEWRDVTVKYVVRFREDDGIVVYLLRLTERRKRPKDLKQVKDFARDLSLAVIRKKLEDLLDGGE